MKRQTSIILLLLTFLLVNIDSVTAQQKHEYVNLGLPSGTLWATCNVGADNPEDYGNYFAWGETEPKDTYSWSNYKHGNGSDFDVSKKYNRTDSHINLDPVDDAATVNWGCDWRMPTADERDALISKCYWVWTSNYKGHSCNGYIVYKALKESDKGVQINGKSADVAYSPDMVAHIFLPAAGWKDNDGKTSGAGFYGYYWSSSLDSDVLSARGFSFYSSSVFASYYFIRSYGRSVRPVRRSN